MLSNARSERLAHHPALPLPVDIRPLRSARRLRLRIDDRRNVLTLTCPARHSRRLALEWAAGQSDWVARQLAEREPAIPFVPGQQVPIAGRARQLCWDPTHPRNPRMTADAVTCGGPREGFEQRIERFLKAEALRLLSEETAEFADRCGVTASAVAVGDAATRWGSCSSGRRIRYSWRLILAPPEARRFVVAHEVAHLVHLNHGPAFRALERELVGDGLAAARASLAGCGRRLRRFGR